MDAANPVKINLAKVSARTAAEVAGRFKLGPEAGKLLREGMSPAEFLSALTENKLFVDAIPFLAHGLGKREAVWWALGCAREVSGPAPAPKIAAALKAVDAWVSDPTEVNRRACMVAAEGAEIATPAGCCALSAFFSGGSLAPPDAPVVPPGEFLTAHAAGGAILLAAVVSEPENAAEKHASFLARGVEIANGPTPWKTTVSSPGSQSSSPTVGASGSAAADRPTLPPFRSTIRPQRS